MKTEELTEILKKYPGSEVWGTAWNGYVETYSVIDRAWPIKYEEVQNDFFGTPGRMDSRVLNENSETIILLDSKFGRFPNKEIDFGNDNLDYPIKTLNGENGDPNLVWKINGFQEETPGIWIKNCKDWQIMYNTETEILQVLNYRDQQRYEGKVTGIETLRNIIEMCKIDLKIMA